MPVARIRAKDAGERFADPDGRYDMPHIDLRAFCGADSNLLAWWSPARVDGCLGYAAWRRVDGGAPVPLTAYVPFATGTDPAANAAGKPSTTWPFQRFTWSDFGPHPGHVEYRVAAMVGPASAPVEGDLASDWVAPVPPTFNAAVPYFNFGTVSSRWFSTRAALYPREFDALRKALAPTRRGAGDPTSAEALTAVLGLDANGPGTGGETIGDRLGGQLARRVKQLLTDARDDPGTQIYAALFELSDPELIGLLGQLGQRCHLILANGTHKRGEDENAAAAAALAGKVDLSRRMLHPNGAFAHNKFVVVEPRGKPTWAWTGSTNWSPHGLYTQSNNGLELRDPDIAASYLNEWHRLRAAGDTTPPPPLEPAREQYHFSGGATTTSVFFSPHHLPRADAANSPDLAYANALIRGAKQGVLSLMLDPGWTGSLLQTLRQTAAAHPDLYVRGVVNTDPTQHAHPDDASAIGFLHGAETVPSNYDVVLPTSQREPGEPIADYLGRVGIVVVHSKIIVVDPLGAHPVVLTGSHNMGVHAATVNDDNLVIVEGDRELAIAHALNVISVFNHFWWRYNLTAPAAPDAAVPPPRWSGLTPSDAWQDRFYASGSEATEARFWGVGE